MRLKKLALAISAPILFLACAPKQWLTAEEEVDRYQINQYSPEDKEIKQLIDPYKKQLDQKMEVVLGELPERMAKSRPESGLGNWMADAYVVKAKEYSGMEIDFGFQNYGGIRVPSIEKGPLTVGEIYELMPFDNMLVIMKMKGTVVNQLFGKIAESGGWPVSKEVRLVIKDNDSFDLTINGVEVDEKKIYTVALLDYIANGGSDCDFLTSIPQIETNRLLRDVLIEFANDMTAQGEKIFAPIEGRIIKAK